MRLTIACVFLALCGTIYANQAVFQELAQINTHPFGATMLAAVSTNLRVKTPIDDVSNLLQKILDDLLADADAEDRAYQNRKTSLEKTIEDDQHLVDSLSAQIGVLEDSLASERDSRDKKTSELTDVNGNIATTTGLASDLEAEHDAKVPKWDADLDDLNKAIDACNRALAKMKSYRSATGASLLQIASSAKKELQQFSNTLNGMKTSLSQHGAMYSPLIHELIEMTQDPEGDKASRVVDLLSQLLALLQAALNNVGNERAVFLSNYETLKAQYQSTLSTLGTTKTQLETDLAGLESTISEGEKQLGQLRESLTDAQGLLDGAKADWSDNESRHSSEQARFDNLIAIMRKIIKHFNENVAAVDEWTAQQINGL